MTAPAIRYTARPGPVGYEPFTLVLYGEAAGERRFAFHDQVEIGRDDGRAEISGVLLVADPAVSRRHCILTRHPDGRCFIRDVSRNGTRVDGRRLVPNLEVEVGAGQAIAVSEQLTFVLSAPAAPRSVSHASAPIAEVTLQAAKLSLATVLVGDIRDFTVLVRTVPADVLQRSVNQVFAVLADEVRRLGGTVKEFQGDALVAFWEEAAHGVSVAEAACHSVLELDRVVRRLSRDRAIWQVAGHPLGIDWALATGQVMINGFGGAQPAGLSVVGEPIVLAFRLEKFADAGTGRILACPETRRMAATKFEFRDLGRMLAKGFDRPDHVFALECERA